MNWRERIVTDPEVLRGKPRIKGTRIPVKLVLGYFGVGRQEEEILKEFPELASADLLACLHYAKELSG